MKADYVHKDSRTLEEKPQVFTRWIDPTIEELKQENQSLKKENKILRENAENNDKVVDKVNWENMLLKKKYENAVADYETTMFEKEQLNSLVNSCQEKIRQLNKQLEEKENIACNWKDSCLENAGKIEKLENQQKEFISYLENEIKSSLALDTINKQTAMHIYSTTLRKYKSIIGDINDKK